LHLDAHLFVHLRCAVKALQCRQNIGLVLQALTLFIHSGGVQKRRQLLCCYHPPLLSDELADLLPPVLLPVSIRIAIPKDEGKDLQNKGVQKLFKNRALGTFQERRPAETRTFSREEENLWEVVLRLLRSRETTADAYKFLRTKREVLQNEDVQTPEKRKKRRHVCLTRRGVGKGANHLRVQENKR
jgi:hypothetical protein